MIQFLVSLFIATASAGTINNLDINDVSILLPLPAVDEWNNLPTPELIAAKGPLLPSVYYKKIPSLVGVPTNEMLYSDLRVVGIRLDPCFHEGAAPIKCISQVRMVWQPLEDVKGVTSTMDSSLHSFYELTDTEFKELLTQVSALKKNYATNNEFLPLGVNPFLKKNGLQSEYYKKLSTIIFAFVGEKNLTRITFMQLFLNGMGWDFGGFDIVNQQIKPIMIPRVNSKIQRFVNSGIQPRPVFFQGGILPEPIQPDNLNIILRSSRKLGPDNEAEIIAAARSAFQFENPSLHNPGTLDCVSCHVAQAARLWTSRQYPWLDIERTNFKDTYKSERNLNNLSPMQIHTNVIRAFGYFMNRPIVAQRTINESADVIKYIEANF